jgi:uncharacterized membrane protein
MGKYLTAYISTLLVFVVCDGIWLGLLMGPTYQAWLGPLMLKQPLWGPAVTFYMLYGVGIVVFGVMPGLRRGRLAQAAGRSALLGLIAYGTYDLTNWATLQGWPTQMALVDLAWGTVVSGLAGAGSFLWTRRFA